MSGYKRQIVLTLGVAGILIVGVVLGLYVVPGKTSSGTTSNIQNNPQGSGQLSGAGNLTAAATYISTFTAQTSTLFSTTTSSSSTSESTTSHSFTSPPSGTFSYSPNSPVKVLAVNATLNQDENQTLSFAVKFQNIANSTIYVIGGGGSSLGVTILSGPVQSNHLATKCEIASIKIPVDSGQTYTSYTPGCWTGYNYVLLQPGTIMVRMTLDWSENSGAQSGITVITADFSFN